MSDKPQAAGDGPIPFETVLEHELDLVALGREGGTGPAGETVYKKARAMKLSALAFSGGGIRSAVFNLGFLQGLGNRKAVHGFDYLSTVSGGGYVGGWLSALLQRAGEERGRKVDEAEVRRLSAQYLATPPQAEEKAAMNAGFQLPESKPVRFLRGYADYLDPRLGLSGDTLALLTLMVRNVAVMQMLLVSMLVSVFALLLLLAGGKLFSPHSLFATAGGVLAPLFTPIDVDFAAPGRWLVLPALILLLIALAVALWSQTRDRERGKRANLPNTIIAFGVLLPALSSGLFLALALELAAINQAGMAGGTWVAVPVVGYGLAWLFTLKSVRAWVGMLGGASTLGILLYLGVEPLSAMLANAPFGHVVAFAPPVAMALQSLVIVVHLALAGSAISEQNREWWARAGGVGMLVALVWMLAFCFLLYMPPLLQYGQEWSVAGGGLWAALSWFGTQLARGGETGGKGGTAWKEVLAKVAPWVFLAGLLALVAWAFVNTLSWVSFESCCTLGDKIDVYQTSLASGNPTALGVIFGGAGVLFVLLLVFVDLNIFSAHSFYRNRLARTFMGASHEDRKPNAFTGFDQKDDMPLANLAEQRPYHLINTNLNMTGGEELAWQNRRGASFVFTARHVGYSTCTSMGYPIGGYRPTKEYAGGLISLATAVAVSGAAASPNMGFHTSTSVAALLTAFNLRLARWCPNPARKQWKRESPRWSAVPLFSELFGEANGRNAWLNLSDGGHFDNLGLYELVRRRAALIVVTDAAADGNYEFDDLAMVVRKLSVDFGVDLQIAEGGLDAIRPPMAAPGVNPDNPPRFSGKHWAFGRIRYPDGCADGYLIYVKSSLTKDAPVDIRQYRDAHPAFPHESTADQWFDEDQFEAYRHLGQDIAEKLMDSLLNEKERGLPAVKLVQVLYDKAEECFNKRDKSVNGEA